MRERIYLYFDSNQITKNDSVGTSRNWSASAAERVQRDHHIALFQQPGEACVQFGRREAVHNGRRRR